MNITRVRVYYGNRDLSSELQPDAAIIRGTSKEGVRVKTESGTENGMAFLEAELVPGLYCCKIYYDAAKDYGIKYFYLDGSSDSYEFTFMMEPLVPSEYMERVFSNTTDQVLERFYNINNIKGFKTYETPVFKKHMNDRRFLSNNELCEFCEDIAANNSNVGVYYPIGLTEQYGLKTPVLVFSKDSIVSGASIEETAHTVLCGGEREIMLITGGMHGNEPAGAEGVLAYALELCGDYGKEVLSKFGAIILIPVVSADNMCTYTRNYPDGCNSNRDLIACDHDGSRAITTVYNLFRPTVMISCHEDGGVLSVNSADYSVADIHNIAISFNGPSNTPIGKVNEVINGTFAPKDLRGMQMVQNVIDEMDSIGYRAQHYAIPNHFPAGERGYTATRGSYAFLIELSGINSGKGNFALRVHGEVAVMKAIAGQILATEGGVAAEVYEARKKTAVKKFDENNRFILSMEKEICGYDPHPSVYVDGTYKNTDAVRPWKMWSKVEASRPMPTAYVFPADMDNADKILALLDVHGIAYRKTDKKTMRLRRYVMEAIENTNNAKVELSPSLDVEFDNGAYVISTDTADAYLAAYIFEPDSFVAESQLKVSLYNMGIINENSPLYRSEEALADQM